MQSPLNRRSVWAMRGISSHNGAAFAYVTSFILRPDLAIGVLVLSKGSIRSSIRRGESRRNWITRNNMSFRVDIVRGQTRHTTTHTIRYRAVRFASTHLRPRSREPPSMAVESTRASDLLIPHWVSPVDHRVRLNADERPHSPRTLPAF